MPLDVFDILDAATIFDGCSWKILRWLIPVTLVVVGFVISRSESWGWVLVGAGGLWLVAQSAILGVRRVLD